VEAVTDIGASLQRAALGILLHPGLSGCLKRRANAPATQRAAHGVSCRLAPARRKLSCQSLAIAALASTTSFALSWSLVNTRGLSHVRILMLIALLPLRTQMNGEAD